MAVGKKIWAIIFLSLLAYFSFLMLRIIWAYAPMKPDTAFLQLKQQYIDIPAWRNAFYIHVFSSLLALLAGFSQFSKTLLKKRPALHRALGYVYVLNILMVTGPAGLLMSFYANGGITSRIGFILLSVLWILFTAIALYKAVKKNFKAHRIFMIRSFALTLSAVSLRIWKVLLANYTEIPPMDRYRIIAWLGWVLNLLIAEYIICRLYRPKNNRQKVAVPHGKLFLILLISFALQPAAAQESPKKILTENYRQHDFEKKKHWVDSLKQIIRKGFGEYDANPASLRKRIAFVESCAELGLYYEKLFNKQLLPDMKKAIFYYEQVANMGDFPYNNQLFKAAAIKKTISRKLESIYFKGTSIKKNRNKSFEYALQGVVPELVSFYSLRYYGTSRVFLHDNSKWNYETDSVFSLKFNGLALRTGVPYKEMYRELKNLAEALHRRKEAGRFGIKLIGSPQVSSRSQTIMQYILNEVTEFLVKKTGISADVISTSIDFYKTDDSIDILFTENY